MERQELFEQADGLDHAELSELRAESSEQEQSIVQQLMPKFHFEFLIAEESLEQRLAERYHAELERVRARSSEDVQVALESDSRWQQACGRAEQELAVSRAEH